MSNPTTIEIDEPGSTWRSCTSHSRTGVVALNRRVGIGHSRQFVEDGWMQTIVGTIRNYIANGLKFQDSAFVEKVMSGARLGLDDMPRGQLIAGDPQDCIEAVQLCKDQTDADYIICDFGRGVHGGDYERLKAAIELFGREVMPAFR